jgi:hypothetical protein
MNYLEIVLNGYTVNNDLQNLDNYFYREFKGAAKDHYGADEFVNGCIQVVENLKSNIEYQFAKRKEEISLMLHHAENGKLLYADSYESKTTNQKNEETINECKDALNKLKESDFFVNLYSISKGKYTGKLTLKDLLIIKEAVLKAQVMINKGEKQNINEKSEFIPETANLKDWIYPDYIPKFTTIEEGLFQRGFIDNSYQWKKHKTDLAEFACLIIGLKYFKPIVKGKRIQNYHIRQFISERYGFNKTGLTETWKKKKPTFNLSKASFYWINIPN